MSEYIVKETGYPGAIKQEIVGELVRCRDCRWKDNQDDAVKWLPCMTVAYGGNWFCADGERREE